MRTLSIAWGIARTTAARRALRCRWGRVCPAHPRPDNLSNRSHHVPSHANSRHSTNHRFGTANPMGYPSTSAYNAAGLLTSMTDADGRTINYGYDAIGEKTSETWVGGNYTATYQYNAAGQLTEASDPFS
jgi:YD repeat-containing protein